MGSACSVSKDQLREEMRHKRNINHKNNPTESYSNWKEKFALEASKSNPPQVIRDFPRMITYVKVNNKRHNFDTIQALMDKMKATRNSKRDGGKLGKNGTTTSSPALTALNPFADPNSGDNSAGKEFKEEFEWRNKYVKETVLLISELCEELDTFGVAFERAWERREKEYAQQQQHTEDKKKNVTGVMDVHQLFQLCCIESEMLMPPQSSNPNTFLLEEENYNNSTYKFSRTSRQQSLNNTDLTVPPTGSSPLANNTSSGNYSNSNNNNNGNGASATTPRRTSNPISNNNSMALLQDPVAAKLQANGGTIKSYTIHSITFHLMTYIVQSILYVPQQRLRHVLWMPWTTNQFEDVAWTVHLYSESLSEAEYVKCKRKAEQSMNFKMNAAVSNTNLPNPYPSSQMIPASPQNSGTVTPNLDLLQTNPPSNNNNNNNNIESTSTIEKRLEDNDTDDASLPNGSKPNSEGGSKISKGRPPSSKNSANKKSKSAEAEAGPKKEVFVVKHTLESRHYVADEEEKNIPRYDLEWSCIVKLDKQFLLENYHNRANTAYQNHFNSNNNNNNVSNNSINKPLTPGALGLRPSSSLLPDTTHYGGDTTSQQVKRRAEELRHEILQLSLVVEAGRILKRRKQSYSNKWKESRDELAFVLEEQYNVALEEVSTLKLKQL